MTDLVTPVSFLLSAAGATGYVVRDYTGTIVSSGSIGGSATSVIPTPPVAGWSHGWYRLYLTGPNTDATFGSSYGAVNFLIVPQDGRFPTMPARQNLWGPESSGWGFGVFSAHVDAITRSALGLGMGRLTDADDYHPETKVGDGLNDNVAIASVINDWWLTNTNGGTVDPVRSRDPWMAYTGGRGADSLGLHASNNAFYWTWMLLLPKDPTIDSSKVYASVENGSVSGYKLKIFYPNSSTLVETYDNIAAADETRWATVNAASSYVKTFRGFWKNDPPDLIGPTVIGNDIKNASKLIASTFCPLGITHFEGPMNEWPQSAGYDVVAHYLWLLGAALKEGDARAKVMGPCAVDISALGTWEAFLTELGAGQIDGIATHAYNCLLDGPGNINLARNQLETWINLLTSYGFGDLPRWQTEANHAICAVGGVYMPRRARVSPMWWMIWEQYGTPSEHNPYWYDYSHGFWGYPSFMFNSIYNSGSPQPQVGLLATMGRETWGKAFHHRVDFGSEMANAMFCGNVYGSAAVGSVVCFISQSYMDGTCSVTFTVTGTAADLTVVDSWGNESTVAQSSGRVTVNAYDTPTFLRLPAGVNVSVYSVNDWGPAPDPSVGAARQTVFLGGENHPGASDDSYMSRYDGGITGPGVYSSDTNTVPQTATVSFYAGDTPTIERVVVWTGGCYYGMPGLIDFDVQTTSDGVNWTTQATVSRATPSSFRHGTGSDDAGCELETYWKEQWIEDVKFPSPVACSGVRLYVREFTHGGMPDSQAVAVVGTPGQDNPYMVIQEIGLVSGSTFTLSDYNTEVLADSPVVFFDYEETSGTTLADSSGHGLTATVTSGTVAFGKNSPLSGSKAFEFVDHAQATVPSNALLGVGDTFTLETWFYSDKPGGFQNGETFIIEQSNSANAGFHLKIQGQGPNISPGYFQLKTVTGGVICQATTLIEIENWYHLAVTKSGSVVHMYVNGVDVTGTVTNHTVNGGTDFLYLGGEFWAWNMWLDKTAVYSTALSAARILAHYRAGAMPGAPVNQVAPNVEGTFVVGDQVNCVPGQWAPRANKYTYQWQRSTHGANTWSNIGGATLPVYTLVPGDSGKDLKCLVTASTVGGSSSATSSNTVTVS